MIDPTFARRSPGMARLLLLFLLAAPVAAAAQAPPPKPATQAPAPAPAKPRPRAAAAARTSTATINVKDESGAGLGGVIVTVTGATEKSVRTAASGTVHIAGLKAGDHRLRFELEGYIPLERDVTVKNGAPLEVSASLSKAPAPPPAPPPPPVEKTTPAPAGEPKSLLLVDYIEQNAVKQDQLGCTASATTTLLMLREDLAEATRDDADEVIYVVAGEGTLHLGSRDGALKSSSLAIVPRGTARSITRKGRNPMYLLSVVSGPPCTR